MLTALGWSSVAASSLVLGALAAFAREWSPRQLGAVFAFGAGYLVADAASGGLHATINGFAAGALLVMLIDSIIPTASRDAGRSAGLITVLGFAVAAALSSIS